MNLATVIFLSGFTVSASASPWATFWSGCQRYLLPSSAPGLSADQAPQQSALENLRAYRARAASGKGLGDSRAIEALINGVRSASRSQKKELLEEVKENYAWAREHDGTLRRIYNLVLKNALPEAHNFKTRARDVGPTQAYEEYWQAMDQFFSEDGESRFRLAQLKQAIREVQETMRLHPGPYEYGPLLLLGGSTVNGQARIGSDFDGWIFPTQFFFTSLKSLEHRPAAKALATHLDRRIVSSPYAETREFVQRNGMFSLVQPFALEVTPHRIRLIHFRDSWLKGLISNDPEEQKIYDLDWD